MESPTTITRHHSPRETKAALPSLRSAYIRTYTMCLQTDRCKNSVTVQWHSSGIADESQELQTPSLKKGVVQRHEGQYSSPCMGASAKSGLG